jgi:hypothetical protein
MTQSQILLNQFPSWSQISEELFKEIPITRFHFKWSNKYTNWENITEVLNLALSNMRGIALTDGYAVELLADGTATPDSYIDFLNFAGEKLRVHGNDALALIKIFAVVNLTPNLYKDSYDQLRWDFIESCEYAFTILD